MNNIQSYEEYLNEAKKIDYSKPVTFDLDFSAISDKEYDDNKHIINRVKKEAKKLDGVEISKVVKDGPGGGWPQIFFTADNKEAAFAAVDFFYGPEKHREKNAFYVYGDQT